MKAIRRFGGSLIPMLLGALIAALLLTLTPNTSDLTTIKQTGADATAPIYGSGPAGGPVGSPVLSTVSYTNVSDWMIVGDSITVRGYKELAALSPSHRLAVDAWSGRNTALAIDSLTKSINAGMHLPPVLIMATGTNDIFNPTVMPTQIRRLKNLVQANAPNTKLVWVTVQASRPGYAVADQRNSMSINMAIAGMVPLQEDLAQAPSTCGWAEQFIANPARIGMYIDSGGVHPIIGVGTKNWAYLVYSCVKAYLS